MHGRKICLLIVWCACDKVYRTLNETVSWKCYDVSFYGMTAMAEALQQIDGDKQAQYAGLLPQISALISDERDFVANMANVAAVLKEQFA